MDILSKLAETEADYYQRDRRERGLYDAISRLKETENNNSKIKELYQDNHAKHKEHLELLEKKYINTERSKLELNKEYYKMTQTHTQQTLENDIQIANLNAALQKKENQRYKLLVDSREKDLEITAQDLKIKYLEDQIKQAEEKLSQMKK